MAAGEWSAAASVDLGTIPGNVVGATLLVMNDDTYLWLAYDAVRDTALNSFDTASFALDTGHDAIASDGREDQFGIGGWFNGTTGHVVYDAAGARWATHDSPFDTSLPNHAGLAGTWGFGSSDLSPTDHRIYEFRIPLALLGAAPGDTLGLFGGSQPAPGVYDDFVAGYSTWPSYVGGPIPLGQYGDLNLATVPGPVGVSINPSFAAAFGPAGSIVDHSLTVWNTGTAGADTFDLTVAATWAAVPWDAGLTAPLPDTDGDFVPDTGSVPSGGSVVVVLRVSIPPAATGCDDAILLATSSVDTGFSDTGTFRTCVSGASFAPPHFDRGLDLDSDLLYDVLEVGANVSLSMTGDYAVIGDLFSGDGLTFIDEQVAFYSLPPGLWTFDLRFDGRAIYRSGIDGPYRVDLTLIDVSTFQVLDTDSYTTAPYGYAQFEPPPAWFNPPHSDTGVDTDAPPDGLYDELTFTIGLQVNQDDFYEIDTFVTDPFGSFVTWSSGNPFLPAGTPTFVVIYPGVDFYLSGLDGPYTIDMRILDRFGTTLDLDTYITGPYLAADFDPPPVRFDPPHSDVAVDTDLPPDGYYDWLIVSASLDVGDAGNFLVYAELRDQFGFMQIGTATVTSALGLGPQSVDLAFPGVQIRQSGIYGPYSVLMLVVALDELNYTDSGTHMTGFYQPTEFQPPSGWFAGPHSDRGLDISSPPDGAYDWLEIDAGVGVAKAGTFRVVASLVDLSGQFLGLEEGRASLPTGNGTIPVLFDGHPLRGATSGPLLADMTLFDENGVKLDDAFYVTSVYASNQWQAPDATAPASAASVAGYWQNRDIVRVAFDATDPSPSDGIASVALYYRFSADNATWSPWTAFGTQGVAAPGDSQVPGTFVFDFPDGEGYYEFATRATDFGGNAEGQPTTADARVAAFVPAQIALSPATGSFAAGGAVTLTARVLAGTGGACVLASAMVVSLLTTSPAGSFRAAGGGTITTVTIPAGASETTFEYTDTRAGTFDLRAIGQAPGAGSGSVTVSPGPPSSVAVTPPAAWIAVGGSVDLTATVADAYGNPISGPSVAWSVQGPGALSSASGATTTVTASGAGMIAVTATSGSATETVDVTTVVAGASPPGGIDAVGLGAIGTVVGLAAGAALGWFLGRRRRPGVAPAQAVPTGQPPAEGPGAPPGH